MILGDHTVTILRAPVMEDDYGNDARDWSSAVSSTVSGCSVQPVMGAEVTVARDTIVSRWQLYAPDGTDLLATDRVGFDGDTYDVDGEVQRWAFSPLAHVTALLRRSHS